MDPTVIHNTTIVTASADGTIHYDAALAVEGRRIAAIVPSEAILGRFSVAERIDGRGKVVMPASPTATISRAPERRPSGVNPGRPNLPS